MWLLRPGRLPQQARERPSLFTLRLPSEPESIAGMRYRIAQVVLIVLGILFAVVTLSPVVGGVAGGAGRSLGVLIGKAIDLLLTILCFWAAVRCGRKARQSRLPG